MWCQNQQTYAHKFTLGPSTTDRPRQYHPPVSNLKKKCLYEKQSFLLLLRFCSANFLLKLNFWTKNDDF